MLWGMISRRSALLCGAAALAAAPRGMQLCMHMTTTVKAGYRRSLEGYAKAGFRFVELTPAPVREFAAAEGLPAAKRLLSDLGIQVASSGGGRGIAEPGPGRVKALDDLKSTAEMIATLGGDRLVCPSNTTDKFTLDDYKRSADHLREAGDALKSFGMVAMVEFFSGSSFIGTLPTALELTRAAAHPNVKPMFDFYHFCAGLSKLEDLEMIRPGEIHHVHFQDVPRMPRELLNYQTREVPGDGVAPLKHILLGLKRKGYTGPLSIELFHPRLQGGDPYEVAAELRRKGEAVLKQAGIA